ncbi:MAG: ABC transporter permease [Rhodothermaceae bacterium]
MKTIAHIVKKEFLQFKRDPKMFAMIIIAPIIQLIFLGYAANLDVETVKLAFFDQDKTETSRALIRKYEATGYIVAEHYIDNYDDAEELLNKGEVIGVIVIPVDFEKRIERNETVAVQGLFDGTDGNTTSISAGYVASTTGSFSFDLVNDFINKNGKELNTTGNLEAEIRVWYNPELKSRVFMVPGIVGLLLMIITLVLTSLAVVKEKEIGTLEQLIVTPIKPIQLLIGKLVPFGILGFVSVLVVLLAMYLIFGIAVRGNIIFLLFASLLFIFSTLGLGLFVSTISKTQQQAMMLAIFAGMMPMVYFSGFAFPLENMPEIIQKLAYIIPLKYFITIIRGVILKGIGFTELWFDLMMLVIIGFSILFISSMRFSKKLD